MKHTAKAGRGWKVTGGDSGSFHEDGQETSLRGWYLDLKEESHGQSGPGRGTASAKAVGQKHIRASVETPGWWSQSKRKSRDENREVTRADHMGHCGSQGGLCPLSWVTWSHRRVLSWWWAGPDSRSLRQRLDSGLKDEGSPEWSQWVPSSAGWQHIALSIAVSASSDLFPTQHPLCPRLFAAFFFRFFFFFFLMSWLYLFTFILVSTCWLHSMWYLSALLFSH